ncbi:MAG: type IV pilin [Candidatus Methanomethylophilaceae archaeon]
MKKLWNARKDSEGVSPVIATILMVAITVVLAAILMVMVMGMTGGETAPSATITATGDGENVTVTVAFISKTVPADQITFAVGDEPAVTPTWVGGATSVVSGSVATFSSTSTTGNVYMLYQGSVIATATL